MLFMCRQTRGAATKRIWMRILMLKTLLSSHFNWIVAYIITLFGIKWIRSRDLRIQVYDIISHHCFIEILPEWEGINNLSVVYRIAPAVPEDAIFHNYTRYQTAVDLVSIDILGRSIHWRSTIRWGMWNPLYVYWMYPECIPVRYTFSIRNRRLHRTTLDFFIGAILCRFQ